MIKAAVLASGQSLTDEQVEYVRKAREYGRLNYVLAVSNVGLDKAPWADALVSHDSKWWHSNKSSFEFRGIKFSRMGLAGTQKFIPEHKSGCNSGYMAMQIARDIYKAHQIILLGFDMHGTHYFGEHTSGLKNTSESDFKRHIMQFDSWTGAEVINCTPDSALTQFERKSLYEVF